MRLSYPQSDEIEIEELHPTLTVEGYGFTDGSYDFAYAILGKSRNITGITREVERVLIFL